MLTWLAEADRRGAQLVHINPLIEAASRRTIVPHELADMATFRTTRVGTMNVQVRIGRDMALLRGVAKAVFEAAATDPGVLDGEFLESFTHGAEEYRALCEATPWAELVAGSGVDEQAIRALADSYLKSGRVIVAWCMGVTLHKHGVDTVREIVNVLVLRRNIGREGDGPCPLRGHSNVQGNRTCGINHQPDEQFLDRLAEVCHIDPPREHGLDVVRTLEAMHEGRVKVLVSLGGNLALAAPDTTYTFAALQNCALTVHVATKLNRSHVVHGKQALILPCLARTDKDHQASGEQGISVDDSMSMGHISYGMKEPLSPHLRSECAILAGLARATLPASRTPWQWYVEDYDRIRDTMAQVLDGFEDFNERVRHPHGFRISQPARQRGFRTPSGRAARGRAPIPHRVGHGGGRSCGATLQSPPLTRSVQHNDLLQRRPLPGAQRPAHRGLHERRRHARPRPGRVRPGRRHQH
jgi:molybdopterin-dependent oxidoreductase alpha subunit